MKSERGSAMIMLLPLLLMFLAGVGIAVYQSSSSTIRTSTDMMNSYQYKTEEDDVDDFDF